MLQNLRESHNLSRQALAHELNLSPGYILKAEQATFPSPPVRLIEYWHTQSHLDRDYLKQSYYDFQRLKRRDWLQSWHPKPVGSDGADLLSGFCRMWENRFTPSYHPNQYAVSSGLCVPASAVYYAERYPHKKVAKSIVTAVGDLVDYAQSGEFMASMFNDDAVYDIVSNLMHLLKVLEGNKQ